MALMMVHLLTAEKWARRHGALAEEPDFYLGAISPDAIHVRDHDDKSHKDEIHLHNWLVLHPDEVLSYWWQRATPFDIGYGIHALTDALWVQRRLRLLPQLQKPGGRLDISTYYTDTFVTDFRLYDEDGQGKRLFDWVERGRVPTDHPLLTQYELDEWRKEMLQMYRGECPKRGEVKYITCDYARTFIDVCQAQLDEIYGRL